MEQSERVVPTIVETLMEQDAVEANLYVEALALLRRFDGTPLRKTA